MYLGTGRIKKISKEEALLIKELEVTCFDKASQQ